MLETLSAILGTDFTLWAFILLIAAAFCAGYIDAIAGGGGMIQTLALLMAGILPVSVLATNKIVSLSGTLTAVIKYARGRAIPWHLVFACLVPCFLAAALGSCLVMFFSDETITWLIILCIPVALAVTFLPQQQQHTQESNDRKKAILLMSPIAFYDGLVGPGTGTYMALTANKGLHMRFLRATGFAKPLNLATNVGSAVMYLFAGKVIWLLALPMAAASVCGAYLGSHSAIARGDSFIKLVMLCMLVTMLIVNIYHIVFV